MTRTIEALYLIKNRNPRSYRQFAQWFWPDSKMHSNLTNCGNGIRRGAGAWFCAGSFLGKLERQGLIKKSRNEGFPKSIAFITPKGFELMKKERI